MEEAVDTIKKFAKAFAKTLKRRWIVILIVIVCLFLISGSTYVIMRWTAKVVPSLAQTYTRGVRISENGSVSTSISAEELWDEMIRKGYPVNQYLDSPEELVKLMNAELVTQLPDLRDDVTKKIDWDEIFKKEEKQENSEEENNSNLEDSNSNSNESISSSNGAMDLARFSLEYACTAAGCKYEGINSRLSAYGAHFDGSRITFGTDRHNVRIEIKETEKMLSIYDEMVKVFPYLDGWYAACSPYVAAMVYYLGIDTNIKNESSNIKAAAAQDKYFATSSSFEQIPLDSNKTFDEQCEPGDIITRDAGQNQGHTMIYVGKTLAQEYFPGTNGGMVEAGQTYGYYPGVTTRDKTKPGNLGWHCYRPKGSSNLSLRSNSGTINETLQGIIKFKRYDKDGNSRYLTYANPSTFQQNVSEYNNSGSEAAKNFVMSHFTLKENPKASRSTATGTGSFTAYNLTENQVYGLARICAREQGEDSPKGAAAEASLMANLFEKWGSSYGTGADGLYNYVTQGTWFRVEGQNAFHDCPDTVTNDLLNAVKAVLIQGYRTLPKYITEHDWLGDIGSVTNNGSAIDKNNHSQYIQGVSQVHQDPSRFNGGGSTWTFYCFPTESSDPFGYYEEDKQRINDENCYSYEDIIGGNISSSSSRTNASSTRGNSSSTSYTVSANYTGQLDTTQAGDGWDGTYTSSAGITYRAYRQWKGPWAGNGYGGYTIASVGCGPTATAILASGLIPDKMYTPGDIAPITAESGTTSNIDGRTALGYALNKLGMTYEIVESPSAQQVVDLLRSGKSLICSCPSGTVFCNVDHFVNVVDINNEGKVYVLNIGNAGWYDPSELRSKYLIAVDAKAPINVAVQSSDNSSAPGYQAVVGVLTEIDRDVDYDGPDIEDFADDYSESIEKESQYTISTATVNYEDLVQPYILQFDFLWDLLVIGQSKEFVLALADLAYNSTLEVSIYNNLTTTTDTVRWDYKEVTEARINGTVYYEEDSEVLASEKIDHEHRYESENSDEPLETGSGYITKEVVTRTNSIVYALTTADTWIADYQLEYEKGPVEEGEPQTTEEGKDDQLIMDWFSVDPSADTCDVIENAVKNVVREANEIKGQVGSDSASSGGTGTPDVETIDENDVQKRISMQERIKRVDIKKKKTDKVDVEKYIEKSPNAKIKDDKTTAPNFVTLFNSYKYRQNKNNILSATEWIFEIMEENENLANTLDTFKYLLYKSTGIDYGVTSLQEENFYPGKTSSVGGNSVSEDGTYIVDTTKSTQNIVITDRATLERAFSAYPTNSKLMAESQSFLEMQEKYHVNAVFAAAVSIIETSGGTNGNIANFDHQWFNYLPINNMRAGSYSEYAGFSNDRDNILGFGEWITDTTGQVSCAFGAGNYTVSSIGYGGYCEPPDDWVKNVNSWMTQMFKSAGIDLTRGGTYSSSGALGYTGEQADALGWTQYVSEGAKNWPANSAPCAHVSMTCCIDLITGNYSLTPEQFYARECNKYGRAAMVGDGQGVKIVKMAEDYGLHYRWIRDSECTA